MFFKKIDEQISTEIFTYFIPSPPSRTTGYREKDFDTICKLITNNDLSIEILSSISHQNGMWVMTKISGSHANIKSVFTDPRMSEVRLPDPDDQNSYSDFEIERD